MSLIKLANRLTKMFNSLSDQAQNRAAILLRPEKQFIKGIEKGNRKLLSAIQNREKRSIKFVNPKEFGNESSYVDKLRNMELVVSKHPKSLDETMAKRHEIFEIQQQLKHKTIGKELKKIENKPLPRYEKNIKILRDRKNNLLKYLQHNKDKYDRIFDSVMYIDDKISKNLNGMAIRPSTRLRFASHHNPQVLINESKLMQITPHSTKTNLYKYRLNSGEIPELKNQFNFNYFKR